MQCRPSMSDVVQRLCAEETQRRGKDDCFGPDHDYTFYQDLNREFADNYQQAVDQAAKIWKDFARLYKPCQEKIYNMLNKQISDKHYIHKQLFNEMRGNEDYILTMFDSSFDVCRIIYLSKIINNPHDNEAYEQLKQFEQRVDNELENAL